MYMYMYVYVYMYMYICIYILYYIQGTMTPRIFFGTPTS